MCAAKAREGAAARAPRAREDAAARAPTPRRRAQLGMSRIDFLYEGRDAVEVKTPLNAFPLDRIGNPHLLHVRLRARSLMLPQRLHCGTAARRSRACRLSRVKICIA